MPFPVAPADDAELLPPLAARSLKGDGEAAPKYAAATGDGSSRLRAPNSSGRDAARADDAALEHEPALLLPPGATAEAEAEAEAGSPAARSSRVRRAMS